MERLLSPDSEVHEPIPFCEECRPEAGHYQLVMNSPWEGADCYDNVMSWDGMPIGEPDV